MATRRRKTDEQDLVKKARALSGGKIRRNDSVWQTLMRKGVLVSLHIGRYRFEQRLDPETDLGLRPSTDKERKAVADLIKSGVKKLLPPRYDTKFRSIESSARHTLARTSADAGEGRVFAFETPFGPFIPVTNYEHWETTINGYRKRYMDLKDELLGEYAQVRKEVLDDYARIAVGTWQRLRAIDPKAVDGLNAEEFTKRYLTTIRRGFPTDVEVDRSFYFDYKLSVIALPEDLRKSIVAEHFSTEKEKQDLRLLNRMREKVAENVLQSAEDFGKTIDNQLYELTYKVTAMAHKNVNGVSIVHGKTLTQLRNLVEEVKALNFVGHKDLGDWMARVDRAVSDLKSAPASRKDSEAEDLAKVLADIRDNAQARMKSIGIDRTRYKRAGIAETTAEVRPDVRRQRRMVVQPDIVAPAERSRARRHIQ